MEWTIQTDDNQSTTSTGDKKKKNLKHATPTRIKKHKRKQEWRETTGKNKENK